MNKVSRIDGREYTLIEQLPALVGETGYVICEDAEGKRFVCPEDLWLENVPQAEQTAPVCTHSSTQEKIECFLSMFRGVCKAVLQHQDWEEWLYTCMQKRVGTGTVQ